MLSIEYELILYLSSEYEQSYMIISYALSKAFYRDYM